MVQQNSRSFNTNNTNIDSPNKTKNMSKKHYFKLIVATIYHLTYHMFYYFNVISVSLNNCPEIDLTVGTPHLDHNTFDNF